MLEPAGLLGVAAAERAALHTRGARHLFTVAEWSRSLSQPAPFQLQLERASCRALHVTNESAPRVLPCHLDVYTHINSTATGAASLLANASVLSGWPASHVKLESLLIEAAAELTDIRTAAERLVLPAAVRLATQLDGVLAVTAQLPGVHAHVMLSADAAAQSYYLVTSVASGCDAIVTHLADTTASPLGVWVPPNAPTAFTSGPLGWLETAAALRRLQDAYTVSLPAPLHTWARACSSYCQDHPRCHRLMPDHHMCRRRFARHTHAT